ncbi:MAG: M48 family metallopeptidase [Alphaproteobacteria bacterium]
MSEFVASYNDGRTAATRPVRVRIDALGLDIRDEAGAPVARWPAEEVHLVDRPGAGRPIRLMRDFEGGERLLVTDHRALAHLQENCPKLGRMLPGLSRHWRPILMWGAAAAVAVVLIFKVVIPATADFIAQAIPAETEEAFGAALAEQVVDFLAARSSSGAAVCTGAAGMAGLAEIVRRLEGPAASHVPITVRVLDLPVVNAFALPGGQILVFRGLIDFAHGPEEVAGVLAHEMAHVVRRHPVQIWVKVAGAGALIGLLVGDVTGGAVIAGVAEIMLRASYSQELERQADAIALDLLAAAEIDAGPLADFFDRLPGIAEELEGILSALSTHPPSPQRSAMIRANGQRLGQALSPEQWRALGRICD